MSDYWDALDGETPIKVLQQVSDRDPQPIPCPTCASLADFLGTYDDEESGNELAMYRCRQNGHEWRKPSRAMIMRSIGWGSLWRQRRDQIKSDG